VPFVVQPAADAAHEPCRKRTALVLEDVHDKTGEAEVQPAVETCVPSGLAAAPAFSAPANGTPPRVDRRTGAVRTRAQRAHRGKQTDHARARHRQARRGNRCCKGGGQVRKKKAGFPTGLAPKADGLRRVGPNACGTSPYAPTLAGAIARTKGRGTGVWV
jgi:hypothetical protein